MLVLLAATLGQFVEQTVSEEEAPHFNHFAASTIEMLFVLILTTESSATTVAILSLRRWTCNVQFAELSTVTFGGAREDEDTQAHTAELED